ncbi:uncharacterized protein [Dysidea avara]|uniref:uncharacterized protein n=1 Tax=Dysidea avara TaxID=196820 RepID=UPI00332398CF
MEPVPTDPCAGVACAAPECDQSAGLVTPDGECCPLVQHLMVTWLLLEQVIWMIVTLAPPLSGCQLSDGTSVNVGDTYMDQCNTCTCLEGGLGACTRKACFGCTLSNGGWVEVGLTYMDDCNTCTCSGNEVAACTEIACNSNTGVGGVANRTFNEIYQMVLNQLLLHSDVVCAALHHQTQLLVMEDLD